MILIIISIIIPIVLITLNIASLINSDIVIIGAVLSIILITIDINKYKINIVRTKPDTKRPIIPPGIPNGYQPTDNLLDKSNPPTRTPMIFDEEFLGVPTLDFIRSTVYNHQCTNKRCKDCDFFTLNNRFQFKYGETCARNAIHQLISTM